MFAPKTNHNTEEENTSVLDKIKRRITNQDDDIKPLRHEFDEKELFLYTSPSAIEEYVNIGQESKKDTLHHYEEIASSENTNSNKLDDLDLSNIESVFEEDIQSSPNPTPAPKQENTNNTTSQITSNTQNAVNKTNTQAFNQKNQIEDDLDILFDEDDAPKNQQQTNQTQKITDTNHTDPFNDNQIPNKTEVQNKQNSTVNATNINLNKEQKIETIPTKEQKAIQENGNIAQTQDYVDRLNPSKIQQTEVKSNYHMTGLEDIVRQSVSMWLDKNLENMMEKIIREELVKKIQK